VSEQTEMLPGQNVQPLIGRYGIVEQPREKDSFGLPWRTCFYHRKRGEWLQICWVKDSKGMFKTRDEASDFAFELHDRDLKKREQDEQ